MKILNIILSIFIFIFAAASAVFSYFLFEKRAQFVSGHEKMAVAIHNASKALDNGSGTTDASKLTKEILAHDKYADLDKNLPALADQSKKIIAQRDALAEALYRVADQVDDKNAGDRKQYKRLDSYAGRIDVAVDGVTNTVRNRNNVYDAIVAVSKTYGMNIRKDVLLKAADLKSSKTALSPIETYIKGIIANSNTYRDALVKVSRIAGKRIDVNDRNREKGIKAVQDLVEGKIKELQTLKGALAKVKNENVRLVATADKANKEKMKAVDNYKRTANALSRLRATIGVAKNYEPWPAGSEQARARMYGKVTAVSKEYGYFVIDLGERSVVYQESNGSRVPIALKLTSGVEVAVIRKPAPTAEELKKIEDAKRAAAAAKKAAEEAKKAAEEAKAKPEAMRGRVWYTDSGKVISEGAGAKEVAAAEKAAAEKAVAETAAEKAVTPEADRIKGAQETKAKKMVFVTSSRIVRVGENESVVDLPAGSDVQVGDIVIHKSQIK